MSAVIAFLRSMTGRIFLLLLVGTGVASLLSLTLADIKHRTDLEAFRDARTIDRIQTYVGLIERLGLSEAKRVATSGSPGVKTPSPTAVAGRPDQRLNRLLADGRLGRSRADAHLADIEVCSNRRRDQAPDTAQDRASRARAAALGLSPPSCWLVDVQVGGVTTRMAIGAPPPSARPRLLDPWFLGGLALTIALLSWFVARFAARPIRQMADAAEALGENLNSPPIPIAGPLEVRQAAQAFNDLQTRLRGAMAEKAQVLAAVTHDIQTPLTRLRLRVEKVGDPELKDRLLSDLQATQTLVKEGLDLARADIADEPFILLAIDSLLGSIADDEADAGRPVTFGQGCGCDVRVRPQALRRCLSNLVDNAVKHGGSAAISAHVSAGALTIDIDDDGPGVPAEDLTRIFEPFVRLEESRSRETGGSGLGLTIARRLAEETGARLALVGRTPTGLRARLSFPASAR